MRLAVISLVPTPYREPLYESLRRMPGLAMRVFYLQAADSLRGWSKLACSYDAVRVPCLTPETLYPVPLIGVWNPGLLRHLRRFGPDCLLIHGYSYWTQMQAMRWAIRHRIPYFLWADSNAHKLQATGALPAVKKVCLRYFCRHAAGALTIGSSNEAFWRYYGVGPERWFRSPLAVDNDSFRSQAQVWRSEKAGQRQALGLPSGRLLLYVGRFAPQKNLDTLLEAVAICRRGAGPHLSLALVGDGPEKAGLERLIRRLRLDDVFVFGFQPQSELPRFYGIADALVLPSSDEPWGLVVNEAMASGLPVLLSKSVGCLPDLLEEGGNGFSFDAKDAAALAAVLERFGRLDDGEIERMGSRSARLISDWDYAHSLAGIHQALESVANAAPAAGRSRLSGVASAP
ncbi:MAG TPA: glycosyltransferase [Bryobacterales bacterium]|nr:glycosyltransferase [Bryobacterales bacterium]